MYVRACVYKKKVVTLCAFRERVCLELIREAPPDLPIEGRRTAKFGETAPKSRQKDAGFAQICAKNEKCTKKNENHKKHTQYHYDKERK